LWYLYCIVFDLEFWLSHSQTKTSLVSKETNKQNKSYLPTQVVKCSSFLQFSNGQPPRCHHFFSPALMVLLCFPFFKKKKKQFQFAPSLSLSKVLPSLLLVLLLNTLLCLVGCAVEEMGPKLHWSLMVRTKGVSFPLSVLPLCPNFALSRI